MHAKTKRLYRVKHDPLGLNSQVSAIEMKQQRPFVCLSYEQRILALLLCRRNGNCLGET